MRTAAPYATARELAVFGRWRNVCTACCVDRGAGDGRRLRSAAGRRGGSTSWAREAVDVGHLLGTTGDNQQGKYRGKARIDRVSLPNCVERPLHHVSPRARRPAAIALDR